MKKQLFFLVTVLLSIFFIACNDSGDKKADITPGDSTSNKAWIMETFDNFCDSVGIGNFIVDSAKAKSMIAHFDNTYGFYPQTVNKIEAITRSFWMDSSTIFSIVAKLNSAKNYDGVRIHFSASTTNTPVLQPPYQKQTGILIYPTIKTDSGHADVFDVIQQCAGCPNPPSYNEAYTTAESKIKMFDSIYHKNSPAPGNPKVYSLSKAVWIDACVIKYMASLITKSKGIIDGISIRTAAYQGTETRLPPGAKAKQASTIIFVPTTSVGGNHAEDWTIIPEIIIYLKDKGIVITGAGLNHGELCPQKCH